MYSFYRNKTMLISEYNQSQFRIWLQILKSAALIGYSQTMRKCLISI